MKRLELEKYYAQERLFYNDVIVDAIFSENLENIRFENVTFYNVTFSQIELVHVTFSRCLVDTCAFENVTSRRTYFIDSMLMNTSLARTDFFPSRFIRTHFSDATRLPVTSAHCQVDFEFAFSERAVFFETFVSQLAVIPTSIANAFVMHKLGRVPTLGLF